MTATMQAGSSRTNNRSQNAAPSKTIIGANAMQRAAQPRVGETPGDRLKMRRLLIGMKQEDVAAKVGLSRTAYCQYETNSSKLTVDRAAEVADILGVSRQWLAFGDGPMEAISQIAFRNGKMIRTGEWGLNEAWVESALHGLKTSELLIFLATLDGSTTKAGDAVLLEKTDTLEETKAGEYLCVVDGMAQLAHLSRRSATGAIRVSGGPKAGSFASDEVKIIGRVVTKLGVSGA